MCSKCYYFLCSDVTFSFEKPVYYFTEGISNAKIYVEKIKGSIDEEITLLAFICKLLIK